jgi:hypothetical protein
MVKLSPSDDAIVAAMEGFRLEQEEAVYFVERLASKIQSPTREVAMAEVTLEHIFPERPNPKDWPNMDSLSSYLWHVGNLAVLGKNLNNTGAKNKSFVEKKVVYGRSELEIVHRLLHYNEWTVQVILARAQHLAKPILEMWDFDNASRV